MTTQEFNQDEFEREMKKLYSNTDLMVKGRRVSSEKIIKDSQSNKNYVLSELMYGDQAKKTQNPNIEFWETHRTYN